tara:strand:+ start:220 stop:789 length:570 start_codon:yes stop_codon:yes gene_type:complete
MNKLILLFSIILCSISATAQEDPAILQIREKFKAWQPLIKSELHGSIELFHYIWGANYEETKWYWNELESEDQFLFQKVRIIEKSNRGTFVNYENYSISGDWRITVDYYFDKSDRLYFVFWRMNTFQAEKPLTVEKRLYFNADGELIKELQSTYKMNSKEKSTASFADREVAYNLQLNKMEFYDFWKGN